MGIFSKKPSRRNEDMELRDRIRWQNDRDGATAELMREYKRGKGILGGVDGEDIRRSALRHDKTGFFESVSGKDIEKILDAQGEKKRPRWYL